METWHCNTSNTYRMSLKEFSKITENINPIDHPFAFPKILMFCLIGGSWRAPEISIKYLLSWNIRNKVFCWICGFHVLKKKSTNIFFVKYKTWCKLIIWSFEINLKERTQKSVVSFVVFRQLIRTSNQMHTLVVHYNKELAPFTTFCAVIQVRKEKWINTNAFAVIVPRWLILNQEKCWNTLWPFRIWSIGPKVTFWNKNPSLFLIFNLILIFLFGQPILSTKKFIILINLNSTFYLLTFLLIFNLKLQPMNSFRIIFLFHILNNF